MMWPSQIVKVCSRAQLGSARILKQVTAGYMLPQVAVVGDAGGMAASK